MEKEKSRECCCERQRKKCWTILLLLFALILFLFGMSVYTLRRCNHNGCKCNGQAQANILVGNGAIESKDVNEIKSELKKKIKDGEIAFKINSVPVVQNGRANLYIESPDKNVNLLAVEIYMDNTGEMVYRTPGMLKPNSHIKEDYLTKNISKGEHKATAVFKAYNPDNPQEYRGQTRVGITLYVQ